MQWRAETGSSGGGGVKPLVSSFKSITIAIKIYEINANLVP